MISLFFRALCTRGADNPRPIRDAPPVRGENRTEVAVDVAPPAIWRV